MCSITLDGRRIKLTQDGPTVNHYAGTCACGVEITATVRTRSRPVDGVTPPAGLGSTITARPRYGDRRRVVQ